MKIAKPSVVVLIGFAIIIAGFAYDMRFAGLPFQDPTPEVYANWLYHSRIGSRVILVGLVVFLLGALWGITRRLARWFQTSK